MIIVYDLLNGFFDKKLTANDAENIANYTISSNIAVIDALLNDDLKSVELSLGSPLLDNEIYTITIQNVADCRNNSPTDIQSIRFLFYGKGLLLNIMKMDKLYWQNASMEDTFKNQKMEHHQITI